MKDVDGKIEAAFDTSAFASTDKRMLTTSSQQNKK